MYSTLDRFSLPNAPSLTSDILVEEGVEVSFGFSSTDISAASARLYLSSNTLESLGVSRGSDEQGAQEERSAGEVLTETWRPSLFSECVLYAVDPPEKDTLSVLGRESVGVLIEICFPRVSSPIGTNAPR